VRAVYIKKFTTSSLGTVKETRILVLMDVVLQDVKDILSEGLMSIATTIKRAGPSKYQGENT
jgi:hypothetical protein